MIIEFHCEYLEREVIPRDAKILLLRPATVHLIAHIQGTLQSHCFAIAFSRVLISEGQRSFTAAFGPTTQSRQKSSNLHSYQ